MADYEVLAPGGHAHLVSDVKSYADRAGGKGTTQLADGSVTRDKLADGVTDRIDAMHDRCDTLVGNHFFNELADGTVLTTDDAFAAPPKGVDVYGASTQASYTGKNLVEWVVDSYTNTTASTQNAVSYCLGSLAAKWTCPSSLIGQTIVLSMYDGGSGYVPYIRLYDADGALLDMYSRGTRSGTRIYTVGTVSEGTATIGFGGTLNSGKTVKQPMVEVGTTMTAYEPYVGGKPAPSPDYPQEINSVDDLTLYVCGFNVWDEQWEIGSIDPSTGENAYSSTTIRSKNYITVFPATQYYFQCATSNFSMVLFFYDADKNLLSSQTIFSSKIVITPDNCRFMRFRSGSYGNTYSNDICINISDTLRNGTYAPYTGTTIPIPLSNHIARSLPDGTKDTLTLTYQGPSTEHEGWGVYSKTLVQRTEHVVLDGSGTETYSVGTAGTYNRNVVVMRAGWINAGHPDAANSLYIAMCDRLEAKNTEYNTWTTPGISGWIDNTAPLVLGFPSDVAFSDKATFKTWLASNPLTIDYALATPITHDLGEVELPILPNPLTAWADGGSAQPTMAMSYEQDINIVIARLEAAIADLATA